MLPSRPEGRGSDVAHLARMDEETCRQDLIGKLLHERSSLSTRSARNDWSSLQTSGSNGTAPVREVQRSKDRDGMHLHGPPRLCQLAVAADSAARSTMTAPGRIIDTVSFVIRSGAFLPGMLAVVMTISARATAADTICCSLAFSSAVSSRA